MIITCEKCQARYLVPDLSIGTEGRSVRCTNCEHLWFQELDEDALEALKEAEGEQDQEPDLYDGDDILSNFPEIKHEDEGDSDDALADFDEDEDEDDLDPFASDPLEDREQPDENPAEMDGDIPAGVLPEEGSHDTPALLGASEQQRLTMITNYGACAAIFLFVFLGLIVLKGPLTKTFPSFAGYYNLFGLQTALNGQALIFETLNAKSSSSVSGKMSIRLDGGLLNLKKDVDYLSLMQADFFGPEGDILHSEIFKADGFEIKKGETLSFSSNFENIPDNVSEVSVHLLPAVYGTNPDIKPVRKTDEDEQPNEDNDEKS